jgi:3-deoxy-7-phosphoheptulonate synthase
VDIPTAEPRAGDRPGIAGPAGPAGPQPGGNFPDAPDGWRALPAAQQPEWPDRAELDRAMGILATLPPLVFAGECDQLEERLGAVARGEAFVLQGGDCAETFAGATADAIRNKVKTILQMAVVLTYGACVPVVKLGRMAGQFAKPRSSGVETRVIDGTETRLPAYRGDAVNGLEFTASSRTPDPWRLLRVYNTSAATLNLIRAFTHGGFADLRQIHQWNQGFLRDSAAMARYEATAGDIDRAVSFMHACGADPKEFRTVDFYASHEALILDYERALTRVDSRTGTWYDVSGHLVWLGERTRQIDGAHVEFASRIRNPVAVKLGPSTTADEALALVDRLDPHHEPGRLTFITRMGAGRIREALPPLLEKVTASGAQVGWVCDPMHGNTIEAPSGHKTRRFEDVVEEVRGFFEAHRAVGTWPGGLHVELTGDDVTECVGGSGGLVEGDLGTRYETACDPRLNHQQSLELAFLVSEMLARR